MSELANAPTGVYAVPPESIEHWRYVVYFENLALWKETNPQYRANIAKQLAEWTQILVGMEAEAAEAAARGEG